MPICRTFLRRVFTALSVLSLCSSGYGQVPSPSTTTVVSKPLPIPTQIKKTVVFLRTDCLHDYTSEIDALTVESLLKLPPQQRVAIAQNLAALTSNLRTITQIGSKLSANDLILIAQQVPPADDQTAIANYIIQRGGMLVRMTSLTQKDLSEMKPAEIQRLPSDQHLGTGFLIALLDSRIAIPPGVNKSQLGFSYLVTNHHVVEPGVESGNPCPVLRRFVMLNHKPDSTHSSVYSEINRVDSLMHWSYPDDESVDLAVTPISVDENTYDSTSISSQSFITEDEIQNKTVVEGDPVLFSGLFVQSFNENSVVDPIVRSGTLAMVPNALQTTTIKGLAGHIFLAEAHAFGGNSGSPMFIDTNKFAGVISGPSYKLLGVISGEVFENADMTFSVTTTTVNSSVHANSDISMIVPATELIKVLNKPELKLQRDSFLEKQKSVSPTIMPTAK